MNHETHSKKTVGVERERKRQILVGARKAHSSMAKVIRMLEEDRYCIEVMQQSLAVQGLWKKTIYRIFSEHLRTCFAEALRSGTDVDRERVLEEVIQVLECSRRS